MKSVYLFQAGLYFFLSISAMLFTPFFSRCHASEDDFVADYDVTYSVTEQAVTIVTQNIGLTNQKSNVYAMEYTMTLDSSSIENVIAYDPKGSITPQVSIENGRTIIHLTFLEKRYGIGKRLPFTIRYESRDIAKHLGSIWEISLPGISKKELITSYKVHLQAPASFGPIAYAKPPPLVSGEWILKPGDSSGILIAFGSEQTYRFDLTYLLTNSSSRFETQTITLPPDTVFQHVAISDLTPKPDHVEKDGDGNWIASYAMSSNSETEIHAKLYVTVSMKPRDDFAETMSDERLFTRPQPYWEATDSAILALSSELKTPLSIYSFLVSTFQYNFDRISSLQTRYGALKALNNPTDALCSEFTDAFIALARAANIPARRAIGYAYTSNNSLRPLSYVQDVLHTWPEYFDKSRGYWVPIDPTWSATTHGTDYFDTFDFSHVVFAHQGISSEYPLPAGFYKKASDQNKTIQASFEKKSKQNIGGSIDAEISLLPFYLSGISLPMQLLIHNTSGVAFNDIPLTVSSNANASITKNSISSLPPFASVAISGSLGDTNWWSYGALQVVATVNAQTIRKTTTSIPLYFFCVPVVCVVLVVRFLKRKK